MSDIRDYEKALRARAVGKRVQQLSWNLAQIEKRFVFEQLEPHQYEEVLQAYQSMHQQLIEMVNELNQIYNVETANSN